MPGTVTVSSFLSVAGLITYTDKAEEQELCRRRTAQ
jgi:hypothetical protein